MSEQQQKRKRGTANSKRAIKSRYHRRTKKKSKRKDRSYYIRKEREAIIEKRHRKLRAITSLEDLDKYISEEKERHREEDNWMDTILPGYRRGIT